MQNVLLEIGFCVMVVVDQGGTFKGTFKEMCDIPTICWQGVARNFHRFLNKSVTMETNDRQHANKEVVIPTSHLAAYACDSAPIDGTNIIHSVPSVG
jgi:hypothetical protein